MTDLSAHEPGFAGRRPALYALASAYFVIGAASLGAVGMVEQMRGALGVSAAAIAALVTIYSLIYAACAPLAQALIGHLPRRKTIAVGLGAIAFGCLISALASSYEVIVAARLLMAMGAAAVGPSLTAAAASLVAPRDRPRALALVFGGVTLSSVLGIPLASFLAQSFGWRWAWAAIGLLALSAAPLIWAQVPGANRGARASLASLLVVLRNRALALSIASTGLAISAQFCTYALIAVWLTEVAGAPEAMVPAALLLFGVGGVAGNALSSGVERWAGISRTVVGALSGCLLALALLPLSTFSAYASVGLVFLWALFGMMCMAPIQSRLVGLDVERAPLSLALNGSAVYFGMALGATVSAVVYESAGAAPLPFVSAGVMAVGIVSFALSFRRG